MYNVLTKSEKEKKMTDFRDHAFELVEDGMVDPMMMLTACLKYMSQEEVADMLEINEMTEVV